MGEAAQTVQTPARNFALEAQMKARLRETASPETCPGLYWTRPPKGRDFIKICPIYLEPTKRPDRAMAPCPICSPNAPQYYSGFLVWFPFEGVYRCIGHNCAAHYIGHEQALAADREYKARSLADANYAFAFENLGNVPKMIQYMFALLAVCQHANSLLRALGKAHLKKTIYDLGRGNGGALRVWNAVEVERPDALTGDVKLVTEHIPEDVGVLRGWMALKPSAPYVTKIRIALERLGHMSRGNDDEAQLWVIDHGEKFPGDLKVFRDAVIDINDLRRKALGHIAEVRAFFTPENFQSLGAFAGDRRNPHRFYAEYRNGEFRLGEKPIGAVRLTPKLPSANELPVWPEIVHADQSV